MKLRTATPKLSHRNSKQRTRLPSSAAWLTASIALCLAQSASAQPSAARQTRVPAHLTLSGSVEHTDNVARVETNELSDTIYSVGTDFQWSTREGSRTHASIDGTLSYYKYTEATYQPEVIGTALGILSYDIVPDFFSWQFQDSFRQARIDAIQPVTPDNRQDANLFMTGPHLEFPLGSPRTRLTIDGQYERANYSVSTEDSEVLLGRAAVVRELARGSMLSFSATARQVAYKQESAFPDYDAQDYLASWTIVGNRTLVELEAGYSFTQQADREDDSPYLRASISRDFTPRTTVSFFVSHQLTGSSDAIHFGQVGGGSGPRTSEFAVNPDPFTLDQVGLIYTFTSTRSGIDAQVSMQEDRYEVSTIDDRDTQNADLQVWTMLNAVWTIGAFGGYSQEQYIERGDVESTYIDYGVFAGARLTPRIRLEVSASHNKRDTNFEAASEYEETTGRITLSYTWGEPGYSSGIGMPRSTR